METSRILRMFGIGEAEWNLLGTVGEHAEIDGRRFLTPQAATQIDPQRVVSHLFDIGKVEARMLDRTGTRAVDAWRDDLALRLHAYFDDRSAHIMISPGIATKADLLGSSRPGTWQGEFWRSVMLFKSWPAALVRMGLGREIFGQERPAAIAGVLHMALMGTVLGYGIMVLKDLAKGREPRDPASPSTWFAAATQGGGFGILGDFLFGDYNRFGQNFSETALGPVIGQGINSVLEVWNRIKDGKDVKAEIFRDALNNTPFINLFYTRLALDYAFLWQIQEALNPGFVRRFERRVRDQNHQKFWLSPSAVVESHAAPRPRNAHSQPWSWTQ